MSKVSKTEAPPQEYIKLETEPSEPKVIYRGDINLDGKEDVITETVIEVKGIERQFVAEDDYKAREKLTKKGYESAHWLREILKVGDLAVGQRFFRYEVNYDGFTNTRSSSSLIASSMTQDPSFVFRGENSTTVGVTQTVYPEYNAGEPGLVTGFYSSLTKPAQLSADDAAAYFKEGHYSWFTRSEDGMGGSGGSGEVDPKE